jgi:hypothetical protein
MTPDSTPREIPPVRCCGSYRLGHDVHFIQVKLSRQANRDEQRTIRSVDDNGTIVFTDGTTVWHHDPERLRIFLADCGPNVLLGAQGLLKVPQGGAAYCFSVATEPDPCRPDTLEHRRGESIGDELLRRGGLYRSGRSVLDELG